MNLFKVISLPFVYQQLYKNCFGVCFLHRSTPEVLQPRISEETYQVAVAAQEKSKEYHLKWDMCDVFTDLNNKEWQITVLDPAPDQGIEDKLIELMDASPSIHLTLTLANDEKNHAYNIFKQEGSYGIYEPEENKTDVYLDREDFFDAIDNLIVENGFRRFRLLQFVQLEMVIG